MHPSIKVHSMFPRIIISLLFLLATVYPNICLAAETPAPVIVSIPPQKYILERIGGDSIKVDVLLTPGSDPHNYEPLASQMRLYKEAKVWFTIGIPFEDLLIERVRHISAETRIISLIHNIKRLPYHSLEKLTGPASLGTSDNSSSTLEHTHSDHDHDGHTHAVSEHATHEHASDSTDLHSHGSVDPHVWLSPMLVREMLPGIARKLGEIVPADAARFRANARAFADELEKLDNELADLFQPFPEEKRVFLTFHPSWQYFALNYALTELSIEADGKEPGLKTMMAIAETAKKYGINTIFIEPQFSRNAAEGIASSLGAKVVEIDPLAEDLPALYRDVAQKLAASFQKN